MTSGAIRRISETEGAKAMDEKWPTWKYFDLQSEHWPGWSLWPPELTEKEEPGHKKYIVWLGESERDSDQFFLVYCMCGNRWVIKGPCPPPNYFLIKCKERESRQ
ncbi:MAG: hypothetical protein DRP09_19170 [Candidatus Thorarchaeota archaeon]|nr:MAG: hypothetical protein DRP09_19170 [Candidatus Thorarchaeota archaeon]